MTVIERLNAFFDVLPRTRFGEWAREAPAFRSLGIAGYYVAAIATLGGGLLTGRSLGVLAAVAAVCALSFYVYGFARKWLLGVEELVLLEHVWFALACAALALWAFGEPILWYLDPAAAGLSFFLAFGRAGCTLVGCCHGQPSIVGIVYPEGHAREGFPAHLVGVRLFPVQPIELIGLVVIGIVGLAALPFAAPGAVLAWFLVSYSVMRFGLEGIRGDPRPHWLGLSQSRWMAIAELVVAVALMDRDRPFHDPRALAPALVVIGTLVLALVVARVLDRRPKLLGERHVEELRAIAHEAATGASPEPRATSRGASIAISTISPSVAHVSLSLPDARADLPLATHLAAASFPDLVAAEAVWSAGVLHFALPLPLAESPARSPAAADALQGAVLRGRAPAFDPQRAEAPRVELAARTSEDLRAAYFGKAVRSRPS